MMSTEPGIGVCRWLAKVAGGWILMAAAHFASAGTWRWPGAWWYLGLVAVTQAANVVAPRNPVLLAQRSQVPKGAKNWDLPMAVGMSMIGPLATAVTAGLDWRLDWIGYVSGVVFWQALAIAAAGAGLGVWAMRENPFFLPVLHIRAGQRVVQRGPYALIRHPGYAGAIVVTLAMPYVLGSRWAVFPAMLTALLIVVRTWAEDRTLQTELPGYREYARRVRARLLPGVW